MTTLFVWTGVALIGGIGSVARFLTDRWVTRRVARPCPVGTLAVNISGAALLGFLGGLALSKDAALLAGTAFVGAYTTFSTWMLETQRLGEERRTWAAAANIVVSVVLGVAGALLGQWLAEQL
ncbi:fluoride efflux transporter CrcB [Mycobacterium genavense]|uniref:fluoride efflux transporter CrcB n=1 Tax=Mycobacterium genavense TaxID=36812 RepID=UPI000472982F|nr:fluoride efflux transporter CrcB [Mycobacterium genavense]